MPKRFYTALAILLAAVMALSFLPIHGETEIYDTVVRLHVLANSDSGEDQALKLTVRDAVLEITTPLLRDCPDRATAAARIEDNREAIRTAAEAVIAAAGRDDLSGTVTVELGRKHTPAAGTRTARSLPGGTCPCASASGRRRDTTGGASCFRRCVCRRRPPGQAQPRMPLYRSG